MHFFSGHGIYRKKEITPKAWWRDRILSPFEDDEFYIPAMYDEILKHYYGDYMTPLKEEDRDVKVHAEIVDLEHSYEDYLEQQEHMTFSQYTRSIR